MWNSFRGNVHNNAIYQVSSIQNKSFNRINVGGLIWASCIIDSNGDIYVGTTRGKFLKIRFYTDSDPKILWSYRLVIKTDSLIDSSAFLSESYKIVFVPGGDGFIHALNTENGKLLWRQKDNNSVSDEIDMSGVIVNSFEGHIQGDNNFIYAGCDNDYMYCFDYKGKTIWRFKTNMMIWTCSAIFGNFLLFGSLDKYIYCVDRFSGKLQWKYNTGAEIKSSPVVSDNKVYICNSNGKVLCFAIDSGKLIFLQDVGKEIYSTCVVYGEYLIVTCFDGVCNCLCSKTGNIKWRKRFYNNICSSPLVLVSNNNVYIIITDSSGYIYCLSLSGYIHNYIENKIIKKSQKYASPSICLKTGSIYIGGFDGYIYSIGISRLLESNNQLYISRFLKVNTTHFELKYNGIFLKEYILRYFDTNSGEYNNDMAICSLKWHCFNNSQGEVYNSSNGKSILAISCNIDTKFNLNCSFYEQTDDWVKDRFKLCTGDFYQSIILKRKEILDDVNNIDSVRVYVINDIFMLEPSILDVYIPAAIDAVFYKAYIIHDVDDRYIVILIGVVDDQGDITLNDPNKVVLLEGRLINGMLKLKGSNFTISSMGGTITFNDFKVWLGFLKDKTISGEFIASASCLGIKGNGKSYTFSKDIVNQLCDNTLNIRAVGVLNGFEYNNSNNNNSNNNNTNIKKVEELWNLRKYYKINCKVGVLTVVLFKQKKLWKTKISLGSDIFLPMTVENIHMITDGVYSQALSKIHQV